MRRISIALLFSLIGLSGINAQSPYQLFSGGATSISSYELANGLVGIGYTHTPQSQLTVMSKPGSPAKYTLEVQNISSYGAISIGSTNIPSFIIERTGTYVSPTDGDFTPIDFSGTDFIVNGSGYTGIGTSTPQAKLHLYSTWIADPVLWAGSNNYTQPAMFIDGLGYTSIGTPYADAQFTIMPLNKEDDIIWASTYNADPSIENPAFVVDVYGNVGIGTGTPQAALDVQSGVVRIGNVTTPNAMTYSGADGNNGYGLYVQYGVLAESFKCAAYSTSSGSFWTDYVFDKNYKLKPLSEVESYIKTNHHLPDVPSTDEVECTGIDMAKMDATLLKKIEELTLYMLNQQKEIESLKSKLSTTK